MSAFGELRSQLHAPPHALRWDALIPTLEVACAEAPHEALIYARALLRRQGPHPRHAPIAWLERLMCGEDDGALLSLCDALVVPGALWRVTGGAARLEACPHLDGLHALTLGGLSDEDAKHRPAHELIMRLLTRPSLTHLRVIGHALGPQGLDALLSAPRDAPLRHLEVQHSALDDAAIAQLASSSALFELRRLILIDDALTDHAARALARAEGARGLRWLALSSVQISAGYEALRDAPQLTPLIRAHFARLTEVPHTTT